MEFSFTNLGRHWVTESDLLGHDGEMDREDVRTYLHRKLNISPKRVSEADVDAFMEGVAQGSLYEGKTVAGETVHEDDDRDDFIDTVGLTEMDIDEDIEEDVYDDEEEEEA